jgi:hypothetical protein
MRVLLSQGINTNCQTFTATVCPGATAEIIFTTPTGTIDGRTITGTTSSTIPPDNAYPVGTTTITYDFFDETTGASASCDVTVVVIVSGA